MRETLKKIGRAIAIPVTLIVGYGLMSVIFIIVGISVGTAICWLLIETFFNPSATLFISDIILFVGMYLFFTSKFFKRNWKEFWGQLKNNL